jgi:hypothetical protein
MHYFLTGQSTLEILHYLKKKKKANSQYTAVSGQCSFDFFLFFDWEEVLDGGEKTVKI